MNEPTAAQEYDNPKEGLKCELSVEGLTFHAKDVITGNDTIFFLDKSKVLEMFTTCLGWMDKYGWIDAYGREVKKVI